MMHDKSLENEYKLNDKKIKQYGTESEKYYQQNNKKNVKQMVATLKSKLKSFAKALIELLDEILS